MRNWKVLAVVVGIAGLIGVGLLFAGNGHGKQGRACPASSSGQEPSGDEGGPAPPPPDRMGHGGPGPGHFLRMLRRLDLTDEQAERVRSIVEEERTSIRARLETMAEIRKEMDSLSSGEFTEEAARTLAQKHAAELVEVMVAQMRTRSRVQGLLTSDQQAQLKAMEESERNDAGPHRKGPMGARF